MRVNREGGQTMRGIIDRFEEDYVVIEIDGKTQDIDKSLVDLSVKVGDVVILNDGIWKTNTSITEKREQEIKNLMNQVWEE